MFALGQLPTPQRYVARVRLVPQADISATRSQLPDAKFCIECGAVLGPHTRLAEYCRTTDRGDAHYRRKKLVAAHLTVVVATRTAAGPQPGRCPGPSLSGWLQLRAFRPAFVGHEEALMLPAG